MWHHNAPMHSLQNKGSKYHSIKQAENMPTLEKIQVPARSTQLPTTSG